MQTNIEVGSSYLKQSDTRKRTVFLFLVLSEKWQVNWLIYSCLTEK